MEMDSCGLACGHVDSAIANMCTRKLDGNLLTAGRRAPLLCLAEQQDKVKERKCVAA